MKVIEVITTQSINTLLTTLSKLDNGIIDEAMLNRPAQPKLVKTEQCNPKLDADIDKCGNAVKSAADVPVLINGYGSKNLPNHVADSCDLECCKEGIYITIVDKLKKMIKDQKWGKAKLDEYLKQFSNMSAILKAKISTAFKDLPYEVA